MPAPTTIEARFTVTVQCGTYLETSRGSVYVPDGALVTHELRAEVTFTGVDDEPSVEPLERAHWVDCLGREVLVPADLARGIPAVVSDAWLDAQEHAIETAWQNLQARMSRAS